jgi:hypothetical protein
MIYGTADLSIIVLPAGGVLPQYVPQEFETNKRDNSLSSNVKI